MFTFVFLILSIVSMIILLPFTLHALAKLGVFFTTLESGDIKFIMRGNSLYRIINDTPKGVIGVDGEVFKKSAFNKRFGLYWIGIPPFANIHSFSITRERPNPAGKTPGEWISREKGEMLVSSLPFTFPHPYILMDAELSDRIPVNVLVVAKFEVVNPYIPIFGLKGNFLENAGAIVRSAVSDILKQHTLEDFIRAEKGEGKGILSVLKDHDDGEFNKTLINQVGLRLVGISIPQYEPSNESIRAAMNAEVVAQQVAKAKKAEAEGYKAARALEAEADADYQEKMAEARGKRVRATREALAGDEAAAKVLQAEALPNLTTLVEGGGKATTVVPTKDDK